MYFLKSARAVKLQLIHHVVPWFGSKGSCAQKQTPEQTQYIEKIVFKWRNLSDY